MQRIHRGGRIFDRNGARLGLRVVDVAVSNLSPKEEAEALALALLERPAHERIQFLQRLKEMMLLAGHVPTVFAQAQCSNTNSDGLRCELEPGAHQLHSHEDVHWVSRPADLR
jgi:hypothetical protein